MSVADQINRINSAKTVLLNKAVSLGIANSGADISALATAYNNINLITFEIGGTHYSAIQGQTWEKWVNTFGSSDFVMYEGMAMENYDGGGYVVESLEDPRPLSNQVITATEYFLYYP